MATGTALTDYLEAAVLNWIKGTTMPAAPATVYLALFTVAPGETGGGTEVTGGSYARQAVTFGAVSQGATAAQISNSAQINFPTATANWGTVAGWALMDALTVGNMLAYLGGKSDVVNSGNQYQIAAGSLVLSVD